MTDEARATSPQGAARLGSGDQDGMDAVFGRGHPNPSRVGCPDRKVLIALARRVRPIADPAYEHLTGCSPCYEEFRAIQEADARRARRHRIVTWTGAAAAVLVMMVAGMWAFGWTRGSGSRASRSAMSDEASASAVISTEIDLRKYTVARGGQAGPALPPLVLPRRRLNLTILLPVGSQSGTYQISVLGSDRRSLASGTGSAEIQNYVTTLHATIDLRAVPRGTYQLAIGPQGGAPHLFPSQLQ